MQAYIAGTYSVFGLDGPLKPLAERLELPASEMTEPTQQPEVNETKDGYTTVKDRYQDDIVAYQVGDFFEFYGNDAETVAAKLNIMLTSKMVDGVRMPMPMADLIGAIRLPDNAFKANAGTEVTSDIIFLQKRDRIVDIEPSWVHLDTDENGIRMNSYFVQHPEMVLGDMVMESTHFGMDSACKAYEGSDLSDLLSEAIQNLHAEITAYEREELEEGEDRSIPADPAVRNFSYTIYDGKVYFRENSLMHPVEVSVTAENRIRGMIALRDCVRTLIECQTEDYPDEDIHREQERLNTLYDQRGNSLAFSEESGYYLLCSLEVLDNEGNFQRKADMFTKRTIRPHEVITSVDTASEALAVSISEKAGVDMAYMAELSGKTEEELETELSGVIFLDIQCAEDADAIPKAFVEISQFSFVTADEYLSGNVRRKLRMAKALYEVLPAEKKGAVAPNIKALEAVQPVDLTAAEIGVRIGANWVPVEIYQQFMYELLGTSYYCRSRMHILRSAATGQWTVTEKTADRNNSDFSVYQSKSPQKTIEMCCDVQANVLIMEVTAYTPWRFEERMKIREEMNAQNPEYKIVLVVDENTEKKLS